MANYKISTLTAYPNSTFGDTDKFEVSYYSGGIHYSRYLTGAQLKATIPSGITVGTTPITSGTTRRVFFQDGTVVSQSANFVFDASNQLVIGGHTGGAKLDVKAGGALSTDIVQRWRNSADSANLGKLTGDGALTIGTYTNPSTKLSVVGTTYGVFVSAPTGIYCECVVAGTVKAIDTLARTSTAGGASYGIKTIADGGGATGTNYGGNFVASGGGTNYAGFFDAINGITNYALYVQRGDMAFGVSPTLNKIGFWNATPIVQPTTAVASATLTGGGGTNITDTDTFDGYTLKQIVKALRNAGLIA